jgi:hypothetical protein
MTTSDTQSTAAPDADFTKTWRYKVGFSMIVVGNLGILLAMFMPILGAGADTVGALLIGGEIVSLASIAFLGKEGFKAIKNKAFAFVKSTYTGAVGKTRHYIGIALLLTNVAVSYIIALYLWDVFEASTAEGPASIIWGLTFAQQDSMLFTLFLIGEISFLVSIYVLGADWWGRFRRIFAWEAPEG